MLIASELDENAIKVRGTFFPLTLKWIFGSGLVYLSHKCNKVISSVTATARWTMNNAQYAARIFSRIL